MKARVLRVLALLIGACTKPTPTRFTAGGDEVPAEPARTYRWSFDDATVGALPADYIEVTSGEWHTLEVTAHGTKFEVSWDGRTVLQANDTTFANGKIGLWTKADSVTAFDDLEAVAP